MRGTIILDVFSDVNIPVDIRNVSAIQRNTGSQYFRILLSVTGSDSRTMGENAMGYFRNAVGDNEHQ